MDLNRFSSATRDWFRANFDTPTRVQSQGWTHIGEGKHSLLIAPTGSGKTLAAFLWGIDRLSRLASDAASGYRLLYLSPLKALVYDIERNLRAPLAGVARLAQNTEPGWHTIGIDVRTGDTPPQERRRQARHPGDILVTTPESLYLLLGSQARDNLRTVETVIVDEIHALAGSKRGAHLALSLERLCEICERDPQRIGLSATVRPAEPVAEFLGGTREVEIVDASEPPHIQITVTVPVPDMENPPPVPIREGGGSLLAELAHQQIGQSVTEKGLWPSIYPQLLTQIEQQRATVIFVNSRGLCERLTQRLNELAGSELVRAHHGSLSHQKRTEIEEALKSGRVKGIVATSSLELGIDMGAVDRVILVESPGSVSRGLQRVGRAGHQVGSLSVGRLYPKYRGDLLEAAVVTRAMLAGEIESLRTLNNPLDVLAQQLVAICVDSPKTPAELASIVRRAQPYRTLGDQLLQGVLDMLSGHYPSTDFADLRPLLNWDRAKDLLSARRGATLVTRSNAGTIPDRGNYTVHIAPDGPRVGELDEEMVFETRPGDTILLGASSWRVEEITRDRVFVSAAPGEPGRLPFWRGDRPGRPLEVGRAMGDFLARIPKGNTDTLATWLAKQAPLDAYAAGNLAAYLNEQREATGTLPSGQSLTIERFRDELGDWRVCILSPFGARLHAPWALAIQRRLSAESGFEFQLMYTDDGIVLRLADSDEPPRTDWLLPAAEDIDELVTEQLADSALFAVLFRENAARSLLLPRQRAGLRNPLWAQRRKAEQLLAAVKRYPGFPLVLETYRQAIAELFDLPALKALLARIESRELRIHEVETRHPSPFARSLVYAYVAAFLYEQDAPIAERKAQALTLDRGLLAELLGQAELRELIDAQVLAELEADLAYLSAERRARNADQLHDLLRRLGDLNEAELAERCHEPFRPWLNELQAQRRIAEVRIQGERRWIAAEDAGLYRDALGCVLPGGLPDAFLGGVGDALEQLLRRYARCHGPFITTDPADRWDLRGPQLEPALRLLAAAGELVRGELRPAGKQPEWCGREVLALLKRRTLARLRNQAAAVDAAALGRFLPAWHGLAPASQQTLDVEQAITRLEGMALPWSLLSTHLLPARSRQASAEYLDMLCASGIVVWVGQGALGARDGKVAIYRRANAARLLAPPPENEPPSPLHASLLGALQQRGACFLMELEQAALRDHPQGNTTEVHQALWDLVWAGIVTNDTFAPLRSLSTPLRRGSRTSRLAGGRWSLVADLVDPNNSDTERSLARAEMLLERYGIVSRESATAEGLPGGFGPIYRVLRAMEDSGRVRRGWYVEGLSGAQFARPGNVDRLRSLAADPEDATVHRSGDVQILAAMDPANPFGTLLPWPETPGPRPRRVSGAWVLLLAGTPVLYAGSDGRQLIRFARNDLHRRPYHAAVRALTNLPRHGRRLPVIEKIDGHPAADSALYPLLLECGYRQEYRGLTLIENPFGAGAQE